MSMNNYAMFELKVNLKLLLNEPYLNQLFIQLSKLELEEDLSGTEIETQDGSKEYNDLQQSFIDRVYDEFKIQIFPIYISNDAEDTDYAGSVIWCMPIVLDEHTKKYASIFESWVEFG